MKKQLLVIISLGIGMMLQAQVSKTVTVNSLGYLSGTLTPTELSTITNLTLNGNIDARDFKTMRDDMPALSVIDLSGVSIGYYNGSDGTSNYVDYQANGIPKSAFEYNTHLTSIILPSTATAIGSGAFYDCTNLISITIPPSITYIDDMSFTGCTGLKSVTLPPALISIEGWAFSGCKGLSSIIIPASLDSIGQSAFYGICFNTVSFDLPSSLTTIGSYAFGGDTTTSTISIPSSVISLGSAAFYHNTHLTSIVFDDSAKVTSFAGDLFSGCIGLKSMTIPSSVKSIAGNVFLNCSGLTSISIPSSVTSIADYAFDYCSGNITVDTGNTKYSSVDGVLFDKTQATLIHCTSSKAGSYIIPSSVTAISTAAFRGDTALTSVTIPSTVTAISEYAFEYCSGLTSIFANGTTPVNLSNSSYIFSGVDKTKYNNGPLCLYRG